MRFIPSISEGYLSKLYFNQAVHNRISDMSMKLFMGLGIQGDQYQSQIAGLASLSHVIALIVESLGIALTCYIITRWI
jgi:hypothetical protein